MNITMCLHSLDMFRENIFHLRIQLVLILYTEIQRVSDLTWLCYLEATIMLLNENVYSIAYSQNLHVTVIASLIITEQ